MDLRQRRIYSLSSHSHEGIAFAFALAHFVPVTEGACARVPLTFFRAHGANRTGVFKKKPHCGHIGVSLACALRYVLIFPCFMRPKMLALPGFLCFRRQKSWNL